MVDPKNQKNVKSLELALVDAQGSKIQATIPARIMKDFIKYFQVEGCVRRLKRFDHGLNISGGYRCSKQEYKIVFRPHTLVESVVEFDISNCVFEFTPLAEITNFVANFDYCCDLVGHIIGYSDPIVDNGKKMNFVEREDERADRLKVTLWDEHADRVLNIMNNNPHYPVVLIVQYVKCKKYYCYTNYEDFVKDAETTALAGIEELDQVPELVHYTIGQTGTKGYPDILEEIVDKMCLFRLDVSDYIIRNNTIEISVARVTTDAEVIKKYLDDVSDDQEIYPELSAEFYRNLTPMSDSIAKTAISIVSGSLCNLQLDIDSVQAGKCDVKLLGCKVPEKADIGQENA
ncbi:OLC1v1012988C1 [Oldenlandia corymbosa var. corymbosa]|uniref:OLC1v1012988C1 n=1 Tax=Oldenlandia corymbosa var. corymbosa TaxID=529605 RepID=A0AAV1E0G8_OLDCO|nr:OLC1v1012988C1 [Oldenlandia corymbosa var. corymbosa]